MKRMCRSRTHSFDTVSEEFGNLESPPPLCSIPTAPDLGLVLVGCGRYGRFERFPVGGGGSFDDCDRARVDESTFGRGSSNWTRIQVVPESGVLCACLREQMSD